MSVLFGGSIVDEFAETVRKQKEEFDSIDMDTYLQQNQLKNKSAEIMKKQQKEIEKQHKSQLSKLKEENDALDAFMDDDEEDNDSENDYDDDDMHENDSNNNNNNDSTNKADHVEYLDVRSQTIFTYSNTPKINKYDKKKNAKKASLAYIQNNNVRTSFKQNDKNNKKTIDNETYFKEDPFLNQKLIRQNFRIDRSMKDHSMIKDSSRIGKMARNNLQFIKEVLTSKQGQEMKMKKNLLFDKSRFNRKLRFAMGAPNKRRQRNYSLFQNVMKKRQNDFFDKKDLYLARGLRVQNRLNDKVLFAKHGRKKIWNAGRTQKNSKRKTGKVGGYETAKSVNDW